MCCSRPGHKKVSTFTQNKMNEILTLSAFRRPSLARSAKRQGAPIEGNRSLSMAPPQDARVGLSGGHARASYCPDMAHRHGHGLGGAHSPHEKMVEGRCNDRKEGTDDAAARHIVRRMPRTITVAAAHTHGPYGRVTDAIMHDSRCQSARSQHRRMAERPQPA